MENSPRLPCSAWIGFGLAFGLLGIGYLIAFVEMERAPEKKLPVIGQIAGFTLTNQDGKITTLADLTNHVWVADIILPVAPGRARA